MRFFFLFVPLVLSSPGYASTHFFISGILISGSEKMNRVIQLARKGADPRTVQVVEVVELRRFQKGRKMPIDPKLIMQGRLEATILTFLRTTAVTLCEAETEWQVARMGRGYIKNHGELEFKKKPDAIAMFFPLPEIDKDEKEVGIKGVETVRATMKVGETEVKDASAVKTLDFFREWAGWEEEPLKRFEREADDAAKALEAFDSAEPQSVRKQLGRFIENLQGKSAVEISCARPNIDSWTWTLPERGTVQRIAGEQ